MELSPEVEGEDGVEDGEHVVRPGAARVVGRHHGAHPHDLLRPGVNILQNLGVFSRKQAQLVL